ncbi:MAG: CBS domain-containing protein [Firmicutes bacterium]|nr:CBS domain-containing protein [Bacillota bacterium]
MITNDIADFLGKVPPFQFLDTSVIRSIASKISIEFYPKGTEILAQEGPPSKYLHVIKKGGVKVFVKSDSGEAVIDFRSEGDSFGFVSLYSGDRSRTGVVAVEDTICYLIDRDTFFKLHDYNPAFVEYFLKSYLVKYVDKTSSQLNEKIFLHRMGSSLPYTTPVGEITTKRLITKPPDTTIQEAAKAMAKRNISSLVIVDKNGVPVGIVTDRDLREKVVAAGRDASRPVKDIMSDSLISIDMDEYCFEAILKMVRHNIHHLLVMDKGNIKGIVTNHDLMMLQGVSPVAIAREIENRDTVESLAPVSAEISNLVALFLKDGAKATNIARIISELNDRLVKRIIEVEIRDNSPPLPFCWVVFGSEGRKEQTFRTDQDNALIYADPQNPKEARAASKYFTALTKRINKSLIKCGFPPCTAGYMANNPTWCQPLKVWKKYFNEWVTSSTPDAILLSTIFFDFRPLYGDFGLANALRDYLVDILKEEKFFLARMASTLVANRPPLGFFRTFVVEKSGEHKDQFNLKVSAIALLVDIVRLFSLERGVKETSTLERIKALKGQHELLDEYAEELEQSFEFMMLLRMLHQLEQIQAGVEPDNFINPNKLSILEKQTLKDIFRLISKIQELIDQRYRLGVVHHEVG